MKFRFVMAVALIFSAMAYGPALAQRAVAIPDELKGFIKSIEYPMLGNGIPAVNVEKISGSIYRVSLLFQLPDTLRQDDWSLSITPAFNPTHHWAPHLTPTDEHIIAQHVFRAPALIVSSKDRVLSILPDLHSVAVSPVKWYLDMNAPANKLVLGLSNYKVREHVLFVRDGGARYPPGKFEVGFYVMVSTGKEQIDNPWRPVLSFYWERWGKTLFEKGDPLNVEMGPFIRHTYEWAFTSWKKNVWQEFELNGKQVGAPVFIVNVTQSPNYPGQVDEREFRSIWNQAWFSSLRSASGLYRYARQVGNADLLEKARKGKELALGFPQTGGFFDGLVATVMEKVSIDGHEYNRSKGWGTLYFGNSNRNPVTWDPRQAPLHILDMSWTASLMLEWYTDLEKDPRLLAYARRYAAGLLPLQRPDGFFPAWLDKKSRMPLSTLDHSPETSMSVTFLLGLYKLTGEMMYRVAAIKAMDAVVREVLPAGQWEDFETYWSCSRYGSDDHVGKKYSRNDQFKQNTLSMYWTAQALLQCYRATQDKKYLALGQRTLDEMLMFQATWQPPYMYVKTLGGFGVMNGDGEWNDSRQSLFAEVILEYGRELKNAEYTQRGIAALRSSFVMMYCPENPVTKVQWEKKYGYFGPSDYGFMMENYGHEGYSDADGTGIGVFTIYDWGNGAAAEAYSRIVDHFGAEIVK